MSIDRQSGSRLPDDPAYWERLAARSVNAAFDPWWRGMAAFDPWWRGISDAAFVLAASAVFALLGGSLLLGERSPRAAAEVHALTGALAPDDPLLGSLLNASSGPPPASALLRLVALREAER